MSTILSLPIQGLTLYLSITYRSINMPTNGTTKNGRIKNILTTVKARAKAKNLPFNLTQSYLKSIATDFCPVFNIPLMWVRESTERPRAAYFNSPSLDRINPQLGYVEGNVVWISMKANYIKSNANYEDIIKVAEWLEKQNNHIKTS